MTARAIQAPILPTETYFVEAVSTTHTPKQVRAVIGQSARNTPSAASTPLPPRNPAKHVKLCPRITRMPATSGTQCE